MSKRDGELPIGIEMRFLKVFGLNWSYLNNRDNLECEREERSVCRESRIETADRHT